MAQIDRARRRRNSSATAVATVPSGNVYLYDGGADLAQKLILSKTATLTSIVNCHRLISRPQDHWWYKKTITGPAAGYQGPFTIHYGLQWHCR